MQILGRKHFVLLPPVAYACVGERELEAASYKRSGSGKLDIVLDGEGGEMQVPFATWDPDNPTGPQTKYSQYASPMRVTLEEGDMLYLPALWYIFLCQTVGAEDLADGVGTIKSHNLVRRRGFAVLLTTGGLFLGVEE